MSVKSRLRDFDLSNNTKNLENEEFVAVRVRLVHSLRSRRSRSQTCLMRLKTFIGLCKV